MPQSWSPPSPPDVGRWPGISRSQLLSSWSPVWIYMLAVRAPHKSKLVVWALSGPGWDNRQELQSWAGYTGTGRAGPSCAGPLCQFYSGQHSGHNSDQSSQRHQRSSAGGQPRPVIASQWHQWHPDLPGLPCIIGRWWWHKKVGSMIIWPGPENRD